MRRLPVVILVIALALVPATATAARVRIRATEDRTWNPSFKSINRGDVVIWRNPTSRNHNVTAYGSNWSFSKALPSGEGVRKRFRRSGHFSYRCTIHSTLNGSDCNGMCGAVHVQ